MDIPTNTYDNGLKGSESRIVTVRRGSRADIAYAADRGWKLTDGNKADAPDHDGLAATQAHNSAASEASRLARITPTGTETRPKGNATTDEWYAWALTVGIGHNELAGLGRDAIVDLVDKVAPAVTEAPLADQSANPDSNLGGTPPEA